MYHIKIQNLLKPSNIWVEDYDSYYLFSKRITKLRYSKKLLVIMSWKESF